MDTQKARDILRHITRDDDSGFAAINALSISDAVEVYSIMLPTCIEQAIECEKENDEDYFKRVKDITYAIIIDKLRTAPKRWVVYDDSTGYPYMAGNSMIVIYEFLGKDKVLNPLLSMGYKVSLMAEDTEGFENEIAHMYRNGYSAIQFVGATAKTFVAVREDFAAFEDFYDEDYIVNPGLQAALIRYMQENERIGDSDKDVELLKRLRTELNEQYINAEYMVPCAKIETEDEITFAHPPIDVSNEIVGSESDEPVIAIPAFTDGFEMDKCYTGERENMLYNINQMQELIDELGVQGFVINYLGQRVFIDKQMIDELCEK
ncbi:MAG: hypothetical protein ACI4EV_03350 [Lachnospiraceae bacterium]